MSGHTLWARTIDESLPVDGAMVQYTRGYLLALEDILKDSEDSSCLADLQAKIVQTQASANQTLEFLIQRADQLVKQLIQSLPQMDQSPPPNAPG